MTQLDCNVVSCIHNTENCCCKDTIEVEGQSATKAANTCCGSFHERNGHSCKNTMEKNAKKATDVACEAKNCIYNEDGYCDADHIGIVGAAASTNAQTECKSFRCK